MPEDYLKEDVENVVRHYLGKTDSEVVDTIVRGVSKGYDKKKLSGTQSIYLIVSA